MASAIAASLEPNEKFYFMYSYLKSSFVRVKVVRLQGKRKERTYQELVDDPILRYSSDSPDYYVTVQVFADGRPLAIPTRTAYKAFTSNPGWGEWLTLPVKYSDLPPSAIVAFTIWDICGPGRKVAVGSTAVSVYGKYNSLRKGSEDLRVWPDVEASQHNVLQLNGLLKDPNDRRTQMGKMVKKLKKGQMPQCDWLDRLAFRELEAIIEKEKKDSNLMFLEVEFPSAFCDEIGSVYDIAYYEKGGDEIERVRTHAELVRVFDPDLMAENLVETKHHKLTHSLRHGPVVKDLKPNKTTRDHLQKIINTPPSETINQEDQALLWKFRYFLTGDKKALPKFLRYIDWGNKQEADQALELLEQWVPMDIEASLELLSKRYKNKAVRRYAVSRLQHASDEDLYLYLPQLVQALRYEEQSEEFLTLQASASHFGDDSDETSHMHMPDLEGHDDQAVMIDPLGGIRVTDPLGGIPISAGTPASTSGRAGPGMDLAQRPLGVTPPRQVTSTVEAANTLGGSSEKKPSLGAFLVARASQNFTLSNFLYWYLVVESEDCQQRGIKSNPFMSVMRHFHMILSQGTEEQRERFTYVKRQCKLVNRLQGVIKQATQGKEIRLKKSSKLRTMLSTPQFTDFEPFPLMLDPSVMVRGILPAETSIFKSALQPTKIHFITTTNEDYVTIFKNGDDLRQDQLILQMVTLMDKLLQKENLDLQLTPYRCLATSTAQGFVQMIKSEAVAHVLAEHGSIQAYFKQVAPCEEAKNGIQPDVMDAYVRSCAGYCVITYLLGIGDRHLDNLLLTSTGKLFHIDFGFILGHDPKPFPPPMKLSKEMVDGMGGNTSPDYQKFRSHCYNAFLILRRSATNLILNLFELMVDANIGDIALEPDRAVFKVQEKFRLDMSEEQAVKYFQQLIDESVNAVAAVMAEQIHKWAQYWRR